MNNHADFHDKEHYSPDCPKCREDKSRDNLLTEIAEELRKDDDLLLRVGRGHWEDVVPIILAKIREVVEGAGLTDEEILAR